MGNLIQASCGCGYNSEPLRQGIGFNFMQSGSFYEPAYCNRCGIIEMPDGSEPNPACSQCNGALTVYRPQVIANVREEGVLGYEDIPAGQHWHCPACQAPSLKFTVLGMWD